MNTTETKDPARPVEKTETPFKTYYNVIAPLLMKSGVGEGKTSACVMAQAATIDALRNGKTLDTPTDNMECACPVLRRLAIRLNDTNWWKNDEERTEVLRPIIPLLLDSKGDKSITDARVFFVADKAVRDLTPMRLEFIAERTKNEKVKADCLEGAKKLRSLVRIKDKASALKAREACETLRKSAYADASASAYADASASAYAYASADAYAYASADAYADAKKLKYRAALLQCFYDCASIKPSKKKK